MKKIILLALIYYVPTLSYGQMVSKTMLRLPDTGASTSYTNTFGEDNDFNLFTPFYINNGNGTLTDGVTDLMWQQKDGGEMTIENAMIYCDTLSLGGYTDWRLPNAHESFSILNMQNTNPALDASMFITNGAEYWWTSNRQANDTNKVWVTNAGGGIGNHLKTETLSAGGTKKFHARAVRDRNAPTLIANHFTDNGNGTITDNLTNLIWQKMPFADTLTWEQALVYADTVSLGGMNDWRLPNIKELQSISEERLLNPSLNTNYFAVNSAKKYWSSTSLPNQPTKAWYLNTQFGITTYEIKTHKLNLILVKGDQIGTRVNEISRSNPHVVFPNPFNSMIQIKNKSGTEQFELTNIVGKIIYYGKDIDQQNFSNIPNGLYFLRIFDNGTILVKLVKG